MKSETKLRSIYDYLVASAPVNDDANSQRLMTDTAEFLAWVLDEKKFPSSFEGATAELLDRYERDSHRPTLA